MNSSAMKVPETTSNSNEQIQPVETRVETVDYRSSAGQGQEKRSVEVIHHAHPTGDSVTSGRVLADAAAATAAAVASTFQSAKDAISGK